MFCKTGELKKAMKAALKGGGLTVGYMESSYLVCTTGWGIFVHDFYASNKFKAALIELIGDLPEEEECYRYTMGELGVSSESVEMPMSPYDMWKSAKDAAVGTPILLSDSFHEYVVYQRSRTLEFLLMPKHLTMSMLSPKELEKGEPMPKFPTMAEDGTLFYKNEGSIYYVRSLNAGEKCREVLFPHLEGISFFESDWLAAGEKPVDESAAAEEQLLY